MTTRPLWSTRRRLAALEGRRRLAANARRSELQEAIDEIDCGRWEHDFGLPWPLVMEHEAELGTLAAAELGIGNPRHLADVLARSGCETSDAASARLEAAFRAAVRQLFVWEHGKPRLRGEGEVDHERPPFDREGWRPWRLAHPGELARAEHLIAELHKLEAAQT